MTKETMLSRFFGDYPKRFCIFCKTNDEMRNVMQWFLDNTSISLEGSDDNHYVYGIYNNWCCLTTSRIHKNRFDYYQHEAMKIGTVDAIDAQEFFEIVDGEDYFKLTPSPPLSVLFGKEFEKGVG